MVELSWMYKFLEFHGESRLSFVSQCYLEDGRLSGNQVIWVASVLEITPWKERVWEVVCLPRAEGEKTMRVGDRGTLAFG
jgi:hypothetical protein